MTRPPCPVCALPVDPRHCVTALDAGMEPTNVHLGQCYRGWLSEQRGEGT